MGMQQKITAAISSERFFYATAALLVVQASWIALTARYPEVFDEQFHLGIIQLYAHQWSPFFAHQPAGSDHLGALTTNASFLYHYLLSFPYRLLALVTADLKTQIIVLRFINIGLFVWSLFIFRRLLFFTPASRALVHTVLLFFTFIPVVPLLAGQISYDNLFIPLTGLSLVWAVRMYEAWVKSRIFPLEQAIQLALLGLFTATVKFAYLPVLAALGIVTLTIAWRARKGLVEACKRQLRAMPKLKLAIYAVLLLTVVVLWSGVYARDLIRYHSPKPSCERVLSVERCMSYAPWARDYQFAHDGQPKPQISSMASYDWQWLSQSVNELIFTITSNFGLDGKTVEYFVFEPLPALKFLAWTIFISGAILVLWYRKRLWALPFFRIGALVIVLYTLALWQEDFRGYLTTGYPVAIHGRYLLPLLPIMLIAVGLCYNWLLHEPWFRKNKYLSGKVWIVVLALLLLLQGGGFITYIVRSEPTWFWNQDGKASQVNGAVKKVLQPVVIGS